MSRLWKLPPLARDDRGDARAVRRHGGHWIRSQQAPEGERRAGADSQERRAVRAHQGRRRSRRPSWRRARSARCGRRSRRRRSPARARQRRPAARRARRTASPTPTRPGLPTGRCSPTGPLADRRARRRRSRCRHGGGRRPREAGRQRVASWAGSRSPSSSPATRSAGSTPFTIGEGTKEMLKVGPFTLTARCTLDATIGGDRRIRTRPTSSSRRRRRSPRSTAMTCSAASTRATTSRRASSSTRLSTPHGSARSRRPRTGSRSAATACVYIKGSYLFAGVNVAGQPDKCKFGGYIFL